MKDIKEKIRSFLSDFRFSHTLSVAQECKAICERTGIKNEKIIIAAYLHDISKECPIEEQIKLCEKYGIFLSEDTLSSPKTLHSFSAEAFIKEHLPEFSDEEIFRIIKSHTTGREKMTDEEKILYIADYIEPTRNFEECKTARKYFYSHEKNKRLLDDTMILCLKQTMAELKEENKHIHEDTIKAYNYLTYNQEK